MKRKGVRAERELLHMFYNTDSWIASRIAGSGSIPLPSPDLLAGYKNRTLAIECKSLKNPYYHFAESKIQDLIKFSERFGAEAWLAIKFNNKGWFFLKPEGLKKSKKGYSVSLELAQQNGIRFEDLIKQKIF
jgi:Holliday junction resolvase